MTLSMVHVTVTTVTTRFYNQHSHVTLIVQHIDRSYFKKCTQNQNYEIQKSNTKESRNGL